MTTSRWWITVYYAGSAVTALFLALAAPGWTTGLVVGLGVLVLLGILFPFVGWPRMCADPEGRVFAAALVVGLGVGAATADSFLLFQLAAMPVMWMLIRSRTAAVVWNGVLAASGFVGATAGVGLSTGFGHGAALQPAIGQALALAFSVAMGLWVSHVIDVAVQRGVLLARLRAAQGELEALHREAGAAQERERLARDLHDTITQDLAGIVMLAQRGRRELDSAASAARRAADVFDMVESSARDALTEARALVAATAPVAPDGASLCDALVTLGRRFQRETEVVVTVDADPVGASRDVEVVMVRCAQEGLANVRKHAHARTACIGLHRDGGGALLTVADDGVGLGQGSVPVERGFGLNGMRDRVAHVGGDVTLRAGDGGRGAVLSVRVPVAPVREGAGS